MDRCGRYCHRGNECDYFEDFLFSDDEENLDFETDDCSSDDFPYDEVNEKVVVPAVMSALTRVTSNEGLFASSITRSVLTGAATTITAGALAGIPGVAVGAAIAGGLLALRSIKNRAVFDVIKSLSPLQRKELLQTLVNGLRGLGIKNLARDIIHRQDVKEVAITILSQYLLQRFGLQLSKAR